MPQPKTLTEPWVGVSLPPEAVDMVPLGIAKVDRKENFTYANQKLLQIAGLEDWRGVTLAHLFHGTDLDTVREELRKRFDKREASEYPVDLTRPDGTRVPLSITSFPDIDVDDRIVGTLTLVRDLTVEKAQLAMYKLVEQETDSQQLLEKIAKALQPLVPFDRFEVYRLNDERNRLRRIHPRGAQAIKRSYRWWLIPDSQRPLLDNPEPLVINDLARWYEDPSRRHLRNDKAVDEFLREGFVAVMSLPVSQNSKQVASIVLSRKAGKPFTDEERHIADVLPLTEAASVALRNETEGDLAFMLELMEHMSSAVGSMADVAQTIVDKIASHYEWDYVSIFQADEHHGLVRLVAQHATHQQLQSERDSYPIGEGVIGYVFQKKVPVNIGDISHSEPFSKIYLPHRKAQTNSELCVPIGARARWVLNVEDEKTDAFAPEEMQAIVTIAANLDWLLKRTLDFHYRSAIFANANDAILLLDEAGLVLEVNDATCTLLDGEKADIERQPIERFFVPEDASLLSNKKSLLNQQVTMRRVAKDGGEGRPVKVLLSVATLPHETPGRVFVASDLTQIQRFDELEIAQDLARQVADQLRTPLSLSMSWLRREARRQPPAVGDVANRVIRQLQKAELTLDRVMLMERGDDRDDHHAVPIGLRAVVDLLLEDLPAREGAALDIDIGAEALYIRVDIYELRYCLLTVLSYLLRYAAEADRIKLRVRRFEAEALIEIEGRGDALPSTIPLEAAWRGQLRRQIGLGSDTLARLAVRNGGRFSHSTAQPGNLALFDFGFPLVEVPVRP